ncbi:M23 family metallopeptidase [Smaragdicoccus niigatensis]|uniref:M23 family metallopeptidase n=1 Tax=Smaragdicoccus niigatensis TaxID=359359 RepID=UPI0003A4C0AA|nr:M23 family metallopeptidase [Smaragdicoccus niigatensis]
MTDLLSPENERLYEHLVVRGARHGRTALVTEENVEHPHRPANERITRRAWMGVLAGKRRISLVAIAAAAVAVGSAGLSSGSAPARLDPALVATVSTDPPEPTAEVLSIPAAAIGAPSVGDLAKGAWWEQQRAIEEAKKLRPLFVPYTTGIFTSGFGMRWGAMHGGIDVANAIGTPIMAVGDGVIIKSGDAGDGYGNSVKILHSDGTITHYGHMSQTLVAVGQKVLAGDEIGLMGSTGDSTGPHCHFEVYVGGDAIGNRIDPVPWLASRGIDMGGRG